MRNERPRKQSEAALEVGGVVEQRRRLSRRQVRHVPDFLQERGQLPVLELQRDAHVRVLHPKRAQFRQDGQDLAEHDRTARGAALLVQNVHPQRVQVVLLDLLNELRVLQAGPIWN